ncbi:hypothetical protein E2C01_066037 [Portunus trituberculatus]|uniref:Uncharacterized protein n=1 Tax=Portunus trituberculatus TaxID=210409 RepID=A0A5B7HG51_PORTR|nr:hypothetical protein [Portunus trituberculatus]
MDWSCHTRQHQNSAAGEASQSNRRNESTPRVPGMAAFLSRDANPHQLVPRSSSSCIVNAGKLPK